MSEAYWNELNESVNFVEGLYKKHKVVLPTNGGLRAAIDEAKALVSSIPMPGSPTKEEIAARAEQANAIIALASTLKPLDAAGLAIVRYLKQLGTGTLDYGTPRQVGQSKSHFFKDFEAELLVLSTLLQAKVPVKLLPDPSDPVGEMEVSGVFIEVKHPDSVNQVERLLGKFNSELGKRGAYGVFVLALEDAFGAAAHSIHRTEAERDTAFDSLARKIDGLARTVLPRAAKLPNIGGCITLLSGQEVIGDYCSFRRLGNAVIFDERAYPCGIRATIDSICQPFAGSPRLFSVVKSKLAP